MFAALKRTQINPIVGDLRQVSTPLSVNCKMVGLDGMIGKAPSSSDIGVIL